METETPVEMTSMVPVLLHVLSTALDVFFLVFFFLILASPGQPSVWGKRDGPLARLDLPDL